MENQIGHTIKDIGLVEGGYNQAKLKTRIPLRRKVISKKRKRRVSNILHQAVKEQTIYVKNIPTPTRIRAINVRQERDQH